jgi:hypothetical protein
MEEILAILQEKSPAAHQDRSIPMLVVLSTAAILLIVVVSAHLELPTIAIVALHRGQQTRRK